MRNVFYKFLICLFLVACSKNNTNSSCNFLLNARVDFTVNLNLPQFIDLQSPGNSVYIANQGNGGVIFTNSGIGYFAWDAADPNHIFSQCSIMSIVGGLSSRCNCEDSNEYSLVTGQSLGDPLQCTLKPYRVQEAGNNTYFISN